MYIIGFNYISTFHKPLVVLDFVDNKIKSHILANDYKENLYVKFRKSKYGNIIDMLNDCNWIFLGYTFHPITKRNDDLLNNKDYIVIEKIDDIQQKRNLHV